MKRWGLFLPKIVNIDQYLLKLYENIAGVCFSTTVYLFVYHHSAHVFQFVFENFFCIIYFVIPLTKYLK